MLVSVFSRLFAKLYVLGRQYLMGDTLLHVISSIREVETVSPWKLGRTSGALGSGL